MSELNDADLLAEAETEPGRARPHRWTREEAREAALLSRESRANRRDRKPPSDEDIERGLRERAVSDPPAAEILLRWLQRPRSDERIHGLDLDAMTEAQLKALYAGLVRIAALSPNELHVLVQSLLADRANRRDRKPPSDEDIERGLRERAVSDPRAAEILLRWQQRPHQVSDGDELDGLTVEQLEALYAALLRLSALTPDEQSTVLQGLLDGRS
jgi:hypothetical protein